LKLIEQLGMAMLKRSLLLSIGAMGWVLLAGPPASAQTTEAGAFIQKTGNDLIAELQTAHTPAQRRQALANIINATVDIPDVAKFSLGRYWRLATPQQQKDYVDAFARSLIATITGRIGDFTDVKFTVGRTSPNGADTLVQSTISRPDFSPIQVQWLVSSSTGHPKIVDLIAEGTSMRLTERSDYSSYLQQHNGSVQALIDALRQQADAS
jgi:phospholipid transport system substrate-binding protein